MNLSKSEAGKLGNKKSQEARRKNEELKKEKYYRDPPICSNVNCSIIIEYTKRNNKYCSRSCAASVNNALSPKRENTKIEFVCVSCSKTFVDYKHSSRKYCSNKCQYQLAKLEMYTNLREGQQPSSNTRTLGNILREFEGNRCSVCSIEEWNGQPLKMELDHIDGDSGNNSYENLRLVCPNCHSQTDTYKGKNMGKGRASRRVRYAEGKSH